MKKTAIMYCLITAVLFYGWGQSFELSKVTNTVDSVEEAFSGLIEIISKLGSPEHRTDWIASEEIMAKDLTAYLDSVLKNLGRDDVKNYIVLIRKNINTLDTFALSKNRQRDFEHFLTHADSYWIASALNEYLDSPFPPEIPLNYDTALVAKFDATTNDNEAKLVGYKAALDGTPTLDEVRTRLNANIEEQKKQEVQRDRKRLQELKNVEDKIRMELSNVFIKRDNLTKTIRKLEEELKNTDSYRMRLIESIEKSERKKYLDTLKNDLAIFSVWEDFFNGKNNRLSEYLILEKAKEKLYGILDEIPQRQAGAYATKLNDFCIGWGI
jgi:hypothetical protein